jgi:hypothetical protein
MKKGILCINKSFFVRTIMRTKSVITPSAKTKGSMNELMADDIGAFVYGFNLATLK